MTSEYSPCTQYCGRGEVGGTLVVIGTGIALSHFMNGKQFYLIKSIMSFFSLKSRFEIILKCQFSLNNANLGRCMSFQEFFNLRLL